jgi:lupus La protein
LLPTQSLTLLAKVEFYFSDANLPSDKFLWDLTDGANNLPVFITKICEFGRMRRFQPISAVVEALKESHFLDVTGPEGEEQVKRKVPYNPHTPRSKAEARSVYVKGFGDEEPSSQFDIEAFFAPYGPTNAVRLRRTQEKLFKGSVFVEFADEAIAQKFLDLDPKPLWKGKHPLEIESKKSYTDRKEQEIKDGKTEPAETWGPNRGKSWGRGRGGNRDRGDRGHHRNDGDGRGRGDARGDRDPDDWKKRREEDRASGFKDNHRSRNDRGRRDGDRKGRSGRRDRDDRGPLSDSRNREREGRDRYANIFSLTIYILIKS